MIPAGTKWPGKTYISTEGRTEIGRGSPLRPGPDCSKIMLTNDAVAARVEKLKWTAYETNHTSTEKERNSMQHYQYDSKIAQDFYNSY